MFRNATQNSWTNFILHKKCFRLDELFKSTRAILSMAMDMCSKTYKLAYKNRLRAASAFNFISSFVNRVKPFKPWRSLFSWVFAPLLLACVFFVKISDSFEFKPFIWIAFCCFQGCSNLPKLAACNRQVSSLWLNITIRETKRWFKTNFGHIENKIARSHNNHQCHFLRHRLRY